MTAARRAEDEGLVSRRNLLTVIDYSLPSSQPRMFIFDLAAHKLLFRELVAHGKGSGENLANFFSNSPGSLATSLGLFVDRKSTRLNSSHQIISYAVFC